MKASVISRLERLEAQTETGRALDPSERERDLEQFQRAAEEYLCELRQHLGESPENEPSLSCHSESDKVEVSRQVLAYYMRFLRQCARERPAL